MALFGAKIRLVASYLEAIKLVSRSPSPFSLTVRKHYFLGGLKTTAFEILKQLERFLIALLLVLVRGPRFHDLERGQRTTKAR